MESVAPPGAVMLSDSTARLVEGAAVLGSRSWCASRAPRSAVPARRLLSVAHPVDRCLAFDVGGPGVGIDHADGDAGSLDGRTRLGGCGGRPSRHRQDPADRRSRCACETPWRRSVFHLLRVTRHRHPVPCGGTSAARGRPAVGLDDPTARAQVRAQFPDADPQDLLLLDDLVGIADPDVELPKIDPDARRRRLTALINAASWPAPNRRYSSWRMRTGSTRSANPCSPTFLR